MNLYPAIDLYEGEVVRLERGDFAKKTVYSSDPASVARDWENQGAKWLHVVDLEGAKTGQIKNLSGLQAIRKAVSCKIEFGGGVRKISDIEQLTQLGIDRVILGTKALDENFFSQVMERFSASAAVGLDVRNGMVQTQGWLSESEATLKGTLLKFNESPLKTVIYTDIQKDGMLEGPNFEQLTEVLSWTRANVILSGGVSSLGDIERCARLKEKNFEGVIIGKALYSKKFALSDAVKISGKK